MTLLSAIAFIVVLVAFVIDMILWNIVRHRISQANDSIGGANLYYSAQLGNANWMTLGALIALIVGTCAAACGSFGRYRHRRAERF